MTDENQCPVCEGKCCRDSYRGRLPHMGDSVFYEHVCEACEDGTKYIALPTYEDGIAEGERRERAAVVEWLRGQADMHVYGEGPLHVQADIIERGVHRREEES